MMRPLGAKRGELEANTLVQRTLSGPDQRWESTLSMIGAGDVTFSGPSNRNVIINHPTFFDLAPSTHPGVEINTRRGGDTYTLVMPQAHFALAKHLGLQAGMGAVRSDGEPWRPRAGTRGCRISDRCRTQSAS